MYFRTVERGSELVRKLVLTELLIRCADGYSGDVYWYISRGVVRMCHMRTDIQQITLYHHYYY